MDHVAPKERLQPSLLDRLTDDDPARSQEAADKRVLTQARLREAVRRDLEWLFNTVNLASAEDLSGHPNVARSVLNYGIPDLTGKTASGLDAAALERAIRQVIVDFEPRIVRETLKVTLHVDDSREGRNAVTFEIEGDLWSEPVPLQVFLSTEVDLDLGRVMVRDRGGRG